MTYSNDLFIGEKETWRSFWKKQGYKKELPNQSASFVIKGKNFSFYKILKVEDSFEIPQGVKTRIYLLLGPDSFYVGITANLKRRVSSHLSSKKEENFNQVLFVEDVGVTLGPIDASMVERALYYLYCKEPKDEKASIHLDEMDDSLDLLNGAKPSLPAFSSEISHAKNDKVLLDIVRCFCLYLRDQKKTSRKVTEFEAVCYLYDQELENTRKVRRQLWLSWNHQTDNVIHEHKKWTKLIIFLLIGFLLVLLLIGFLIYGNAFLPD